VYLWTNLAQAGVLALVEEIRRSLDYDLRDLPSGDEHRECDRRLYRANQETWKLCTRILAGGR
jgi:hypothetical protein